MNRELRRTRTLNGPRMKYAADNLRLLGGNRGAYKADFAIYQESCSKMGYQTKKEARTVLNERLHQRHGRPEKLREYACSLCGLWHLTKQELR